MDRINIDPLMRSLLAQLESAKTTRRQADEEIAEITSMIQDVPRAAEDPRVITNMLHRIQRRDACTMFDQIRLALETNKAGMTSFQVIYWMWMKTALEFLNYWPCIVPTALQCMMEAGEVKEFTNKKGKKAYRLKKARRASTRRVGAHNNPKIKSASKPNRTPVRRPSGYRRLARRRTYRRRVSTKTSGKTKISPLR